MKEDEFFERVYAVVMQIPRGKVATYGQIASLLGLGGPFAARNVGKAMSNTPEFLDIPSHRVVNKSGEMAPAYAFGGAGKQRRLLEGEGVVFQGNGRIDMKKCLWKRQPR